MIVEWTADSGREHCRQRRSETSIQSESMFQWFDAFWIARELLLRPNRGAEYCDQPVCLSVCLRAYLWNRWTDRHDVLWADPLWPWLSPPPAALRYVMYFRFMDDVTSGRNGREADKGWQHLAWGINYVRDRADGDILVKLKWQVASLLVSVGHNQAR